MTKTHLTSFLRGGALALAIAAAASAQTTAPAPAAAALPSGLLGQDYAGLTDTYLRHNSGGPVVDHNYGFTWNQAVMPGLDAGADYDWLTGSARAHDWTEQALIGTTGYLPFSWGKPFLGGEAGWAWRQFNGADRNGFTYRMTAGAQFTVAPALALAPYASYQQWHGLAAPGWPAHDWNFGVKASYRLSSRWSVTLDPRIDQQRNLGYGAGLDLHF
jgi:hypothetical protein